MTRFEYYITLALGDLEAESITDLFVLVMLLVFIVALLIARSGKSPSFVNYTPNLLTSLGILGTFTGIVVGLLGFDVSDAERINNSIGPLLEGLKTAFITSLTGMTLAILFKSLDSTGKLQKRSDERDHGDIGPEQIHQQLKAQREAVERLAKSVAGDEDLTLISQLRLLRSDNREQSQAAMEQYKMQSERQIAISASIDRQFERSQAFEKQLWLKMDQFAEMLARSATEQVINALKEVISDFNKNLTEQFGENFKALNAAVERLVQWQENYREQLGEMGQQYAQGVLAITRTEEAVAHISEESRQIPVTMADLKVLLQSTQHQLNELERHLGAFRDMRDRAVEAVPVIREQMDNMVRDVSTAVADAGGQILAGSQAVNLAIVQGAEEFKNNVNRTNQGLVSASDHLANNSEVIREQLESTLSDVNENVRNMVDDLVQQAKGLNSTLVDSNKNFRKEIKQVEDQVVDSMKGMQQRLESVLESVLQVQTSQTQRAFRALEEELQRTVAKAGAGMNTQLNAIDAAMQQEIERVMNEMGRALATITGQFTNDYKALVAAMNEVVRNGATRQRPRN